MTHPTDPWTVVGRSVPEPRRDRRAVAGWVMGVLGVPPVVATHLLIILELDGLALVALAVGCSLQAAGAVLVRRSVRQQGRQPRVHGVLLTALMFFLVVLQYASGAMGAIAFALICGVECGWAYG